MNFVITDGLILEAAKVLNDDAILTDIQGKDLVATELQYHRSCYKEYMGFLTKKKQEPTCFSVIYKKAWATFCGDVIENRLIKNGEILRLKTLQLLFVKTFQAV